MYRELREQSKLAEEDLVRVTRELIRIPSHGFRERAVADRIENLLEGMEYDLVYRDEVGNVVAVLTGDEEGPTILLSSHMDTALPEDEEAFTHSPYSGRLEGGRIYGLGATDGKAGLAAQIYAGHVLATGPVLSRGTLVFAATVANENGCGVGLRYLLQDSLPKLGITPDIAILGEPTNLTICRGHDGWAEIVVHIEGATSCNVTRGTDLVFQSLRRTASVCSLHGTRDVMSVTPPKYDGPLDGRGATIEVHRRLYAGELPERCAHWVEKRILNGTELETDVSVHVAVRTERRRFYSGQTATVLRSCAPWLPDRSESVLLQAHKILQDIGPWHSGIRTWPDARLGMGTPGGMLTGDYQIPTFAFGPGEARLAHTPVESVAVDRLVDAVLGTAVLAHDLIGAARFGWAIAP